MVTDSLGSRGLIRCVWQPGGLLAATLRHQKNSKGVSEISHCQMLIDTCL